MIKILIVDDQPIVREGIKKILSESYDSFIADEIDNPKEIMNKISTNDYDIISLEINLHGKSCLQTITDIKNFNKNLPILIFSAYPEEQYAIRALKSGASAYLPKNTSSDELLTAIRQVTEGRKYINNNMAERLLEKMLCNPEEQSHELLSDRELEVLYMIASGKTVSDIAKELFLSVKTISTYRGRLLEKMGLRNNAALTYYAVKHKIIA